MSDRMLKAPGLSGVGGHQDVGGGWRQACAPHRQVRTPAP